MIDKTVDIIIPIYNALDDLKLCLESIYRYTDLKKHRLILINDNSPDENIRPYLDGQSRENVIAIHNEKNMGFSANINIGMSQSATNDVLLLNSDTVVTKRWIEKILACGYSSPEIGTVTPLSNNATLCSVPRFCEENSLPAGIDTDKMADIVERCSMKKYPRISVGHGFCMFVKREVIDTVGCFDAETFEKGYGEENDFCNRAVQAGYINAQCDDTFILHTGTKSFISEEKERCIRKHDSILRSRYPEQMHNNDVYVRDNPNGYVQENIEIFLDLENGKKNILYVTHSDFRKGASDNVGGTQLHVRHLKDNLIDRYNVIVAARDEEFLNITLYVDEKEHFWRFNIGKEGSYLRFEDRELERIWEQVFDAFHIDILHIHHLLGLSFDIVDIAKKRDIPVVMTCHDYYMVTPSIKLLDADYQVIEKADDDDEIWAKTLDAFCGIYPGLGYMKLWRNKCRRLMEDCDKLVVPNITVKETIAGYYPEIENKIDVIEHGYEFDPDRSESADYYKDSLKGSYSKKDGLNIAFIGGINREKGGDYICELAKRGIKGLNIFVFGNIGHQELYNLNKKNIYKYGKYDSNDLPYLMSQYDIDIVCVLSIWKETFSYTMSEALLCGLPVIVTDIGALGERMRRDDVGWLVSLENGESELEGIIKDIIANPELLEEKNKKAKEYHHKTLKEMSDEYDSLYRGLIKPTPYEPRSFDAEDLYRHYIYRRYFTDGNNGIIVSGISDEDRDVLNSVSFKIAKRIRKINFPFKYKIWGILNK